MNWIPVSEKPDADKPIIFTDGINWWKGTYTDWPHHAHTEMETWDPEFVSEGLPISNVTHWAEVELPSERIEAEDELAARYYRGEIDNLGNRL